MFDTIHEECGVFGAWNIRKAASITYYGLHSLQHRGQEASGIAVGNGKEIEVVKGKGLTIDLFNRSILDSLKGRYAIGHVRYSTAGGQAYENVQPIVARGPRGDIAIVHNGQIVNHKELRAKLEAKGAIFQGTSDSEVILHLIQMEKGDLLERVKKTAQQLDGAYSFLVLQDDVLLAVRDPYGIRPLSYTRYEDGYVVASETCAFEVMGVYDSTTVLPGQIVEFKRGLVKKHFYAENPTENLCAMEYIYFARPDSVLDGQNVHAFRKESGKLLARKDKDLKADVVIGVPDSSLSAAIGYAEESGVPLETGLVKNRFVTRTFIKPTQGERDKGVRMKLAPVADSIAGKSVVMIDDSIVRGTTSKKIVKLLKDAGAREVHVRIASPKLAYPCFYGVDISSRKELIGAFKEVDEICEFIGADSLMYLSEEETREASQNPLCMACFSGDYISDLYSYQEELDNDVPGKSLIETMETSL